LAAALIVNFLTSETNFTAWDSHLFHTHAKNGLVKLCWRNWTRRNLFTRLHALCKSQSD